MTHIQTKCNRFVSGVSNRPGRHYGCDSRPSYASNWYSRPRYGSIAPELCRGATQTKGVGSGLRPLYGSNSGHFMVQVTTGRGDSVKGRPCRATIASFPLPKSEPGAIAGKHGICSSAAVHLSHRRPCGWSPVPPISHRDIRIARRQYSVARFVMVVCVLGSVLIGVLHLALK
jgi:hypothetical protein